MARAAMLSDGVMAARERIAKAPPLFEPLPQTKEYAEQVGAQQVAVRGVLRMAAKARARRRGVVDWAYGPAHAAFSVTHPCAHTVSQSINTVNS